MKVIHYEHHGANVAVYEKLKGKHREHCLCHHPCAKFKPNTPENCPIAQAAYENCDKFNIVTPMWECAEFEEE